MRSGGDESSPGRDDGEKESGAVRITGVRAFVVAVPQRRLHRMAFPSGAIGRYTIVRMSTDEGVEGLGEAAAAVAEGIKTIKVKVGRHPEYDVRVVREVRSAVGEGVDIVVDANQGWPTPKHAIALLRRIEESNIRYAEQPVEGIARMAEVTRSVDVPIMADESAWTPQDVLEIAERGAADMISLYTTKPGGLFKAKKVAAVAEAAGLPLNVNGSHETGVGN